MYTITVNKFDNQAGIYKLQCAVEVSEETLLNILRKIPPMVQTFYKHETVYKGTEVCIYTTRSIDELLHLAEPQPA